MRVFPFFLIIIFNLCFYFYPSILQAKNDETKVSLTIDPHLSLLLVNEKCYISTNQESGFRIFNGHSWQNFDKPTDNNLFYFSGPIILVPNF